VALNLSTTIEDLSKWTINFTEPRVRQKPFQNRYIRQVKNGKNTAYGFGQFIDI
jgi:hypothetical protein